MAATRMRKTFKFPSEASGSDSDASNEALDEQEQEQLISHFRAQEDSENQRYRLIFSLLPVTVTTPFIYFLFTGSRSVALLCIMAITSLLSTAYTMWFIPVETGKRGAGKGRFPVQNLDESGPVEKYLPYLNPVVSGLLCVFAWALSRKQNAPKGLWLIMLLPAVMLLIVTVAMRSMVEIETSISELNRLKYGYKGA